MMKRTKGPLLWLLILLSALLYDVAFFFPEYLGFLVLPSLFLIFEIFLYSTCTVSTRPNGLSFCYGVVWGVLVFACHFIWLLILLLDKVKSGIVFAVFAYLFCVTYFAFTTAFLFGSVGFLFKKIRRFYFLIFLATCYGYFYLLENYALWFLGRVEGYPFLNPLIPLINLKLFVKSLMIFNQIWVSGVTSQHCKSQDCKLEPSIEFIYLKPTSCLSDPNLISYEYQIYRKLCDLKLWERRGEAKQFIILAPETSFPFPLNIHPDVIELWSNVLPDNAHLFIGTQYSFKGKICQAVSWVNKRRIKNNYVKKHCVPFVEKIPHIYKGLEVMRRIFLGSVFPEGVAQFSSAKKLKQQNYFGFNDKIIFIPQICSELFFVSSYKAFSDIARVNIIGNSTYIMFFVNDSWFVDYFKKIMWGSATLKSILSGIPLIYIGYEGLKFFEN